MDLEHLYLVQSESTICLILDLKRRDIWRQMSQFNNLDSLSDIAVPCGLEVFSNIALLPLSEFHHHFGESLLMVLPWRVPAKIDAI